MLSLTNPVALFSDVLEESVESQEGQQPIAHGVRLETASNLQKNRNNNKKHATVRRSTSISFPRDLSGGTHKRHTQVLWHIRISTTAESETSYSCECSSPTIGPTEYKMIRTGAIGENGCRRTFGT